MVRLVKGAYWDSEIKRAQVDGLDGYPVYTRKAYTDVAYLACAAAPARGAGGNLSPVRDPQRAHAGGDPRARRRRRVRARAVRVPVPARHGRAALRAGRRQRRRRQARPAVPHLRAGRHARDAARVPRAPPARERRQHLVRQPHRRSRRRHRDAGRGPGANDRADGGERRRADRPAASGDRPAARDLRVGAGQLARPRSRERRPARRARRGARQRRARAWSAAPLLAGAADASRAATPVRNPADHGDVVGQVQDASLADVETALASAADRGRCLGGDRARRRARPCSSAPPTCSRPTSRACSACSLARPARPIRNAIAEVREAVDFLRFYAAEARRDFDGRDATCRSDRSCASAPGTSRSRSSPARSAPRSSPAIRCWPSRPSRRRWSPPRWCAGSGRPACRAPCCSCCPGRARRSARRWSATRACRA